MLLSSVLSFLHSFVLVSESGKDLKKMMMTLKEMMICLKRVGHGGPMNSSQELEKVGPQLVKYLH